MNNSPWLNYTNANQPISNVTLPPNDNNVTMNNDPWLNSTNANQSLSNITFPQNDNNVTMSNGPWLNSTNANQSLSNITLQPNDNNITMNNAPWLNTTDTNQSISNITFPQNDNNVTMNNDPWLNSTNANQSLSNITLPPNDNNITLNNAPWLNTTNTNQSISNITFPQNDNNVTMSNDPWLNSKNANQSLSNITFPQNDNNVTMSNDPWLNSTNANQSLINITFPPIDNNVTMNNDPWLNSTNANQSLSNITFPPIDNNVTMNNDPWLNTADTNLSLSNITFPPIDNNITMNNSPWLNSTNANQSLSNITLPPIDINVTMNNAPWLNISNSNLSIGNTSPPNALNVTINKYELTTADGAFSSSDSITHGLTSDITNSQTNDSTTFINTSWLEDVANASWINFTARQSDQTMTLLYSSRDKVTTDVNSFDSPTDNNDTFLDTSPYSDIISEDPISNFTVSPNGDILTNADTLKILVTSSLSVATDYKTDPELSSSSPLAINVSSGCSSGYRFFAGHCFDKDECLEGRHSCDLTRSECINAVPFYTCNCKPGYERSGQNCIDVDECSTLHPCDKVHGICINTNGSFRCSCRDGFRLAGDGKTCRGVDQCASGESGCQENCTYFSSTGQSICSCQPNLLLNGTQCVPSVPCVDQNLVQQWPYICARINGQDTLLCPFGTRMIGNACTVIDQCSPKSPCDPVRGECSMVGNTFRCSCIDGYLLGPKYSCIDRDGDWSAWSSWIQCSATCNQGVTQRTRFCNNPSPDGAGAQCNGDATEAQDCQLQKCQLNDLELNFGTYVDITGITLEQLVQFYSYFEYMVMDAANAFCNADQSNVLLCCSLSSTEYVPTGVKEYVTTDGVRTVDGFPTEISERNLRTMIVLTVEKLNPLCEAANGRSARRKRRSLVLTQDKEGVPREIFDAVIGSQEFTQRQNDFAEILRETFNGTSRVVISSGGPATQVSTSTGDGSRQIPWWAILLIVLAIVLIILLSSLLVYFLVFRKRGKFNIHEASSVKDSRSSSARTSLESEAGEDKTRLLTTATTTPTASSSSTKQEHPGSVDENGYYSGKQSDETDAAVSRRPSSPNAPEAVGCVGSISLSEMTGRLNKAVENNDIANNLNRARSEIRQLTPIA